MADTQKSRMFNRLALRVFVLGLVASALLYAVLEPEPKTGEGILPNINTSQKYQVELQRIGGQSAVVAAQLRVWWQSLWTAENAPKTVFISTLLLTCLLVLMGQLYHHDEP